MRIRDWSSDVCSSDLPDAFDKTTFRGDLPAGWDAELYRNGQLLAFTSPNGDGRYEFIAVPLQYGSNRFEIVLYGPQGQKIGRTSSRGRVCQDEWNAVEAVSLNKHKTKIIVQYTQLCIR